MTKTHFQQAELDKIGSNLRHLHDTFQELNARRTGNSLYEPFKTGFVVDVGKSTESILKFICKRENLHPAPKTNGGKTDEYRTPTLADYIYYVKEHKIIGDNIYHHLNIIRGWRNNSAHNTVNESNLPDGIQSSTVESVNDSFNYFVTWFYQNYLKDEVPDFISAKKNTGDNSFATTADVHSENNSAESSFKVAEAADFQSQPESKPENKSLFKWIAIITVAGTLLIGAGWFFAERYANEAVLEVKIKTMNKSEVNIFLTNYYSAIRLPDFNAREYFADTVQRFNNNYYQTPDQVKQLLLQTTILSTLIDSRSLTPVDSVGSTIFWEFYVDINYRSPSDNTTHKSRDRMEIGINAQNKITSVDQLDSVTEF